MNDPNHPESSAADQAETKTPVSEPTTLTDTLSSDTLSPTVSSPDPVGTAVGATGSDVAEPPVTETSNPEPAAPPTVADTPVAATDAADVADVADVADAADVTDPANIATPAATASPATVEAQGDSPAADADPAATTDEAVPESSDDDIELLEFASLALPEPVLHAIDDLGFPRATPIQSATLPWSLADYDIVGQAQTGTGKTAAFLLTIFNRLWEHPDEDEPPAGRPRNLVLAPTRELALQIASDAEQLAHYTPFNVLAVVGGIDFDRQLTALRGNRVDLVVATPGRLIDFIERRVIDLSAVEVLVIDEADRMLDMGFIPDVRRIVYRTPHKRTRQTLFFSATFNDDVHRLADQWTTNPFKVAIAADRLAIESITQEMYNVANRDKFKVLFNLINERDLKRVLVFSNRRDSTREVYQRLRALGVDCDMLAGDVPQQKRLKTLENFKEGRIRVLVATDVAGRGLHVEDLSHVVNYNLPEDPEDYVHRIGRTGRAGATGNSISLVCEDEGFKVGEIETLLGRSLPFINPDADLLKVPQKITGERREVSQPADSAPAHAAERSSNDDRHRQNDVAERDDDNNGDDGDDHDDTGVASSVADQPDLDDDPEENIGNRFDGSELPPDSIARAFLRDGNEADADLDDADLDDADDVQPGNHDGPQQGSEPNSPQRRRRRRRRGGPRRNGAAEGSRGNA